MRLFLQMQRTSRKKILPHPNRPLVTDEPVELKKYPVEVQDFRKKLLTIIKESVEYCRLLAAWTLFCLIFN